MILFPAKGQLQIIDSQSLSATLKSWLLPRAITYFSGLSKTNQIGKSILLFNRFCHSCKYFYLSKLEQTLKSSARKDLQEITAPNTDIQVRISFVRAGTSDFGLPALLEAKLAGSGRGSNALGAGISCSAGSKGRELQASQQDNEYNPTSQ